MELHNYRDIAYLLGCYMIIADKEINSLELGILDDYLQLTKDDELYIERNKIFSDDETSVKLNKIISSLKMCNLSREQKEEIVRLLAKIAFGDDYFAVQEKILIDKVSSIVDIDASQYIKQEEVKSEERINSSRMSGFQRTVGKAENFLYNNFVQKRKESTIDKMLGSLGYSAAIEQIVDDAKVDLTRVRKINDKINDTLSSVCSDLRSSSIVKANESQEVSEVAQVVKDTSVHFEELINTSLAENKEILEKKSKNIRYFTIAFMGRTKAGKSTLHKVITQQEDDDIGVGKLRTTRYNRSWYWEKLRIVDTPGIGAPGGDADTEIAKSIIDEADIICYVVTSDSIQETEFDFFSSIKERNKPLYIILNVKSNLSQSIRLKKFLRDPHEWRTCDGPQSIKGHIDRIHDRLDGKYNMDAVEIIPLHLLAAQLSLSGDYDAETSKNLLDGSNIMAFIRSVKAEVHGSGSLKKSLSIIDGTAHHINCISKTLSKDNGQIEKANKTLKEKRSKFKKFVKDETSRMSKDVKKIFQSTKDELHNRAASFASEHYDDKEAGKSWQNDSIVKEIFKRNSERISIRMEDFNIKLKDELSEIASDIQYCFPKTTSSSGISGESIKNSRLFAGVIGAIIQAAAPFVIHNCWNPAGWVVALGSLLVCAVVSIFTSLFTSKAEKIRKATEKLRTQLEENIDKNIDDNLKETAKNISDSINETYKSIDAILTTYIENTDSIIHKINDLRTECSNYENSINSLIGFRVLEFVGRKVKSEQKINQMTNEELRIKYPVQRDWQKQSLTYLYATHLSEKARAKAEKATQMTININNN